MQNETPLYLQRLNALPSKENLSEKDKQYLSKHFDAYGKEMLVDNIAIRWEYIEEVEVVVASRAKGPSGWLVKNFLMGGDRYHVGIYIGYQEAVLTNTTREVAEYVVQTIAYYAPNRIQYRGVEDITPVISY